jgi:hypothetical protein
MLILSDDIRFESQCEINLNGFKADFRGIFVLLPNDQVDELIKEGLVSKDVARKVLVDWVFGDVMDPAGQPVPFSPENLEKLLNRPGAPLAIVKGFFKGYESATAGNSAAPSAGS